MQEVKEMLNSQTIISFGLIEGEQHKVTQVANEIGCQHRYSNNYRNLIAENYFMAIVNPRMLSGPSQSRLVDFFEEMDGNLTSRIFLTDHPTELTKAARAEIFSSFEELYPRLPALLEKARKKAQKAQNTVENIASIMEVLDTLTGCESVTAANLAKKTGRSTGAVRRYLEMLRMMGKPVVYDEDSGLWRLNR